MKTQDEIVRFLAKKPRMTRGGLSVKSVGKSGRKSYNLQYRRGGAYFVKNVSALELPYLEESTSILP